MSPISTPTFKPSGTLTIAKAQNNSITNLSIPSASTEYSHALNSNLKQVIIRCRGAGALKISFTSGESGTKYFSIPKGCSLTLTEIDFTSTTLYVQSDKASQTVEILELY